MLYFLSPYILFQIPKIDLCVLLLRHGITGKAHTFFIPKLVFSDLLAIVQKIMMSQMCVVVTAQKGY